MLRRIWGLGLFIEFFSKIIFGKIGHKLGQIPNINFLYWLDWLREKFLLEINSAIYQRRLFILAPFLMIIGAIIYKIFPSEPNIIIIILLGLIIIFIFFWLLLRNRLNILLLLLLFCWLGFILLPLYGILFGSKMLQYPIFGTYRAEIIKISANKQDGQRVIIGKITPLNGAKKLPIKKARLFVRKGEILNIGDIIEAKIRFAPVPSPVIIGGYDSQFHAYFAGIGSYASTINTPKIIGHNEKFSFFSLINNIRNKIGTTIKEKMNSQEQAIALALIVGNQSKISEETRRIMAISGLAHMLAISGLHLSLVAGGVYIFVRAILSLFYYLPQIVSIKKISAFAGIIAALIYLALSGASISAIRATIMLILIFGAIIVAKNALTMRNVAIAAILVIFLEPSAIFRPSFQLSFAAVIALIATYELVGQYSFKRKEGVWRVGRFFLTLAFTSLIAGLATSIFALFHFQQISPLGILANLAALPILTFLVLPAAFLAVLLMPIGFEAPLLNLMAVSIELILSIAKLISDWSEQFEPELILLPSSLIIALLGLAWLSFFTSKIKFIGPLIAFFVIFIFFVDERPDILISNNTKAIAVRGEPLDNDKFGLALISGRIGSFTTKIWQEKYFEKIGAKMSGLNCDNIACFYKSPLGFSVSLIKETRAAFIEDCAIADLVITRLKAPKFCKEQTMVIDGSDLKYKGMHWLKWQKDKQKFIVRYAIKNHKRIWRAAYMP